MGTLDSVDYIHLNQKKKKDSDNRNAFEYKMLLMKLDTTAMSLLIRRSTLRNSKTFQSIFFITLVIY